MNSRLQLNLRDARMLSVDEVHLLNSKGFDLSSGMLVQEGTNFFYGEEALLFIFLHSGSRVLFFIGRMMSRWNPRTTVFCYRVLVRCRSLLLLLLGRGTAIRGTTDPQ
jgi:hypothetical protein